MQMWGRLPNHMLIQIYPDSGPYLHRFSTAPQRYQNTGLQKDFKLKNTPEDVDPFQSGGLHDEDVISVWPSFPCIHNVTQAVPSALAYPAGL